MASIEVRGESVRVTWPLGGRRGAAKQSCTFSGPPTARMRLAKAAKALAESRRHDLTREECYRAVLGEAVDEPSVVPTFAMWAKQWVEQRRSSRDIEPETLLNYERVLRSRAIPFLGHKRLTDIDRETIRAWVAWMSSSHVTYGNRNRITGDTLLSARSVRSYFGTVSICLSGAVPRWIPVNPAARQPGDGRNTFGLPTALGYDAVFLDAQEIHTILSNCKPDLHDLVYVSLRTGMRMGESIALEVKHVMFGRDGGATVQVRQALKADGRIGVPKSPASVRSITVTGKAAEVLRRRTAGRRASDPVFTAPTGRRWHPHSLRRSHWYPAVAAAQRCAEHPPPEPVQPARGRRRGWRLDEVSTCGCPGVLRRWPHFHDLRHVHVSALIAAGWHAKKIQVRLGHSSYQVTMDIYGHLMDSGREGELQLLEEFLEVRPVRPRHRVGVSAPRPVRRVAVRRVAARR